VVSTISLEYVDTDTQLLNYQYGLYLMYFTVLLMLPYFLCLLSISRLLFQLALALPRSFPQYLPEASVEFLAIYDPRMRAPSRQLQRI